MMQEANYETRELILLINNDEHIYKSLVAGRIQRPSADEVKKLFGWLCFGDISIENVDWETVINVVYCDF